MFLHSVLVTVFVLPALISGNQFPVLNGVIGGVPSLDVHDCKTLKETFSNIAPTATPVYVVGSFCFWCIIIIFTVSTETTPHVHQASGYGDLAVVDGFTLPNMTSVMMASTSIPKSIIKPCCG
jgi:hypothetical protein